MVFDRSSAPPCQSASTSAPTRCAHESPQEFGRAKGRTVALHLADAASALSEEPGLTASPPRGKTARLPNAPVDRVSGAERNSTLAPGAVLPCSARMGAVENPSPVDPSRPSVLASTLSLPNGGLARWFAEEVQPHEAMLRAWLRGRFPTVTDIDDLVQESYARLFRARAAGQVRNARNYLFATARNLALDLFRHDRAIPFEPIGESSGLSVLDQETDVAEAVGRDQELQLLRDAMHALPTRCRQVFTLRKLYGLSHRDIAAQLGISERTVEAQIDKAMRRCASFLRERGLP